MSDIERVKEVSDIIELIGSRLSLTRSGSNFRALCPFHSEKSPSFFVSETMQRYKCFGCGETGDVFTFLEKYEGMTFAESLQYLAGRANITLTSFVPDREEESRRLLLEILELAKEYYHYLLEKHAQGDPARQYLAERGVTAESRKVFSLGYALPLWDGLTTFLTKKKHYDLELVAQTGLILRRRGGGYYDRFRHRLIFPLRNHRGQIVGFSGRAMVPLKTTNLPTSDHEEPKYINTPETLLYHKGQMIYGYSELLQAIRQQKEIVLVEGEFDVISSSQAHVSNVGGLKGSALTADHAKLLSRTVDTIILSLDADAAGIEATKRAITVLKQTPVSREVPLELRVLPISGGKDPDEVARSDPKQWRALIKTSLPAYEFLIRTACQQHDPATSAGKTAILYEVAPLLAGMTHAVEREHYIQLLAQWLHVPAATIEQDSRAIAARKLSRPQQKKELSTTTATKKPSRRMHMERYLLFLWTHAPVKERAAATAAISELSLIEPGAAAVIAHAVQLGDMATLHELSHGLAEDLQQRLFDWHTQPEYEVMLEKLDWKKEWRQTVDEVKEAYRLERSKEISLELAKFEELERLTEQQETQQDALLHELALLRAKSTTVESQVD